MKRCQHDHEALKRDKAAWSSLHFVGVQQPMFPGDVALDLRDCICGSTLAVELEQKEAA